MTRTQIAPAKINLGLEILGRRDDGFHEVRTILVAISLSDRLTFEPTEGESDTIETIPASAHVPDRQNLVDAALATMRAAGAAIPAHHVTIEKRIPAAAGLGGASSDAAATLRAFAPECAEAGVDVPALAAALGSDVPFFLGPPAALATGKGDKLTPLPVPDPAWVVIATPEIEIENKTAAMYRAVDPAWWSDGRAVQQVADRLPRLPDTAPFNVFARALERVHPPVGAFRQQLISVGFPFVALTGAGPSHYTIVGDQASAEELVSRLASHGIEAHAARIGDSDRADDHAPAR